MSVQCTFEISKFSSGKTVRRHEKKSDRVTDISIATDILCFR
ncbi:MAG: hypothetical protein ACRC2R_07385 [Xenococcaceae cyanobacterium]